METVECQATAKPRLLCITNALEMYLLGTEGKSCAFVVGDRIERDTTWATHRNVEVNESNTAISLPGQQQTIAYSSI